MVWKTVWQFLKHKIYHRTSAIPFLGVDPVYPRKMKTLLFNTDRKTNSTAFIIVRVRTLTIPSSGEGINKL